MRTGRPTKALEVTDEERQKLGLLARRPKSSRALAMRARIVLNCAADMANDKVAQKLNVTRPTVDKWRERFLCIWKACWMILGYHKPRSCGSGEHLDCSLIG